MLKHEAVLKPSLISIPPLGDTSFSPGSHSSCPGGAEPAPASAGISTPGDIREHQGGTSLTLAPSTCPRLLLLPCCLFWGHSGRTRTPAPLCTTFQHDWIQPHQNQVSKTTFLLLSGIFFHLSQETIAITRQRTLNARSPSRAGSTQGLGRQGDPALYRCQSNIFDASRDALLLGARASATLTAAEGRGKHKGLLKQPVAGCLSAPGGDTCREPVLWGSALASWDPWHQLQHGPSPRAQPALGDALPPLASGASLEGLSGLSHRFKAIGTGADSTNSPAPETHPGMPANSLGSAQSAGTPHTA